LPATFHLDHLPFRQNTMMLGLRSLLATLAFVAELVQALPDGHYLLQNAATGMFLTLGEDDRHGAKVAEEGKFFSFTSTGDTDGLAFTIREIETMRYLAPYDYSSGNHTVIGAIYPMSPPEWVVLEVSNGDGTTYAIWNQELDLFLSASEEGNVSLSVLPGPTSSQWELLGEGTCWDTQPGELCYNDTIWAKDYAINYVPEWYPGLLPNSSFADFQAHLHYCYWRRCPMPCAKTTLYQCGMQNRFWDSTGCENAEEDSKCWTEVQWAMIYGINIYPDWYPGLTNQSSFAEFQQRLHNGDEAGLETHECPKPCCHDARPGELCFEDTEWARLYGINIPEFRDMYPSYLTNQSSFPDFQAYLATCYPERCPAPCKHNSGEDQSATLNCPDSRLLL